MGINRDSWLRCEYEKCFDAWQFGVSLRFTTLAFWLTLTSGLLVVFFSNAELWSPRILKYVISGSGMVVTLAVWIIEMRNRQIYSACMERAKAIEVAVNTTNNTARKRRPHPTHWQNFLCVCRIWWHGRWKSGHADKLKKAHEDYKTYLLAPKHNNLAVMLLDGIPPHTFSRHTHGICLIYLMVGLLWAILMGLTLFGHFDPPLSPERGPIERVLEALKALIC